MSLDISNRNVHVVGFIFFIILFLSVIHMKEKIKYSPLESQNRPVNSWHLSFLTKELLAIWGVVPAM